MRVDHGRSDISVTQQLLDQSKLSTHVQAVALTHEQHPLIGSARNSFRGLRDCHRDLVRDLSAKIPRKIALSSLENPVGKSVR